MKTWLKITKSISGWTTPLISHRFLSDERSLRKARLLVFFYLATAAFLGLFASLYAYVGYSLGVYACLYGAIIVPILLLVFKRSGSFGLTTAVFDFNAILMFTLLIYGTGGTNSVIVPWLAIVPASGFVFQGWRRGLLMSFVCLLEILVLVLLESSGYHLPILYDVQQTWLLNVSVQIGLVAYILMILLIYEGSKERTILLLDSLNADLLQRKIEVEQQGLALAERNARIAEINANLERMVATRTAKLAQAMGELDTFLYESAHALRRPMASIVGLVEIVQAENDPVVSGSIYNRIDASLDQMDLMLAKLITVSELNGRVLDVQTFELHTILQVIVERRAAWIAGIGATVVLKIAPEVKLVGDQFLLEIALGHVFDNALQYSQKTGRKPEIALSATACGVDMIAVKIRDNGLGIAASEIGRVTEMFFRATAKVPGTGLGLYVVQKALERLEGSLHIESTMDVGTVVELRIPGHIETTH